MSDLDQMRKGTTHLLILKLLSDAGEPLHGYEIIRRLEGASDGSFRFKEGLIYPALHRLEQDGLLKSSWQELGASRRRKVYALTEKGQQRLRQELLRWREFSQHVNRLLGLEEAAA